MKVLAVLGLAVALLSGCGGSTTAQPVPTVTVTQVVPSATKAAPAPSQRGTADNSAPKTKVAQETSTKPDARKAAAKAKRQRAAAREIARDRCKRAIEERMEPVYAERDYWDREIALLQSQRNEQNNYGACNRGECAAVELAIESAKRQASRVFLELRDLQDQAGYC